MGSHLHSRATRNAVAIIAGLFAPALLHAQAIIRGVVYDDATGARIAAAAVMLVDPRTDAAVVNMKTDSLGQFSFKIGHGVYQLAAVHEGRRPVLSAPIPLADGELMTVRVPVAQDGDPVHKIGVTEHVRPAAAAPKSEGDPRLAAFERRRMAGSGGRQFDRARLDESPATTVGDFLTMVPGVAVRDGTSGSTVQMRRSASLTALNSGSACRVGWFLDGIRMDRPGLSDAFMQTFAAMRLADVEAIEVFRGLSEMPAEYAAPELRCGAVAVWTKR